MDTELIKPSMTDGEVMSALVIVGMLESLKEIEQYHKDPSSLVDLETISLDGWSVENYEPLNFKPVKRVLRRFIDEFRGVYIYDEHLIVNEGVLEHRPYRMKYGKS